MAPKTVKPLRWPFNADYMFLEAEKNNEKKRVAETLRWALILKDGPSATLKKLVNEGVMPEDPRFYGLTKKTAQQLVKALKDYKLLEQELETQEYSGYSSSESSTSVEKPVKAAPSSTKDKEASKPVPQPSKSDDPKSDDSNDSDYVAGSDVASDYDDYEEEEDEDEQSGESDANSDRMSVDAESSSEPPAKKKRA